MSAATANIYVTEATVDQRLKLAAMIGDVLRGLRLLSKGARVQVKRSTHLYVVDDRLLSGEGGSGEAGAMKLEPAEKHQWVEARERADEAVGALDSLFAKADPRLPLFLWPLLEKRFNRHAPGRIALNGAPHHWFVGYELLMQPPRGEANGILGAFMEFRLLPLPTGEWRLLLLHIRFPLLAKPMQAPLFDLRPPSPPPQEDAAPDPGKDLLIPKNFKIAPLRLDRKTSPVRVGAQPLIGRAESEPPMRYVLPVEGSNLLAPYYAFAADEGELFAPATSQSAMILIDRQSPAGLLQLKAAIAPTTDAAWTFAWHYAGVETGRPNRPVNGMSMGAVLVLPEGLYDIDLLVTRAVDIGLAERGEKATIMLRTRRMISSEHPIVPVAEDQTESFADGHGGEAAAAGPLPSSRDAPSDSHPV
jgi:hypothetical protein